MLIQRKNLSVIKSEKLNFSTEPLMVKNKKETKNSVKVNFKKEGEIIRIIEITCSCGNKIELFCEYENDEVCEQN